MFNPQKETWHRISFQEFGGGLCMRAIGKALHGKVAHECLVSCPHPCSQPISCQMRVELRCVGSRAAPRFRCPHPRDGPSTFSSLPSGWKRLFVSARFECNFVLRSASAWLFGSRWPHVEQIQTFPAIALEGCTGVLIVLSRFLCYNITSKWPRSSLQTIHFSL